MATNPEWVTVPSRLFLLAVLVVPTFLPAPVGAQAPPSVWILSEPWPASYSADVLANAVRLRIPEASVAVTATEPADLDGFLVRFGENGDETLRVEQDGVTLLALRSGTDPPEDAPRRAALLVAMVVAPTQAPEAAARVEPAPTPEPPVESPSEPVTVARVSRPVQAEEAWGLSAAVGPTFAVEAGKSALALSVRARWVFVGSAALHAGAKLASEIEHSVSDLEASVSDRAFWLGADYRLWWSGFGADVGLSFQYTQPLLDVEGEGEESLRDASSASRFGVRASADVLWAPHPNLALVLGAATTLSFEEREFERNGGDFLELGTVTLDLLGGAEVRW